MHSYKSKWEQALADLGITPPEGALLGTIHYGPLPPDVLPAQAAGEYSHLGGPRAEECREALPVCLAKGWLQILDEKFLDVIAKHLSSAGMLGPIYGGLPLAGLVDFTPEGARLWQRLIDQIPRPKEPPFAYTDMVHARTAYYYRTEEVARKNADEFRGQDEVVSVSDPRPVGPWRVQWWRRYPEGYRIDVEERWHWQGRGGSSGASWYLDRSRHPTRPPGRLQHVLDCHNVTLGEWLILAALDDTSISYPRHLLYSASQRARRLFGITVTEEECGRGLEGCLSNGWVRPFGSQAEEDVRAVLQNDPVFMPLLGGVEKGWGEVDFTPTGALLYQMIAAEYYGEDWDAEIRVEEMYYRKVHLYCVAVEGLRAALERYVDFGEPVRSAVIIPIGPWCVFWWEQYPSGYRMEVEIGDPGQEPSRPFAAG